MLDLLFVDVSPPLNLDVSMFGVFVSSFSGSLDVPPSHTSLIDVSLKAFSPLHGLLLNVMFWSTVSLSASFGIET